MVEAFRVGVEALRAGVSGDTSPDGVAATMDDVQQVMSESISKAISFYKGLC